MINIQKKGLNRSYVRRCTVASKQDAALAVVPWEYSSEARRVRNTYSMTALWNHHAIMTAFFR